MLQTLIPLLALGLALCPDIVLAGDAPEPDATIRRLAQELVALQKEHGEDGHPRIGVLSSAIAHRLMTIWRLDEALEMSARALQVLRQHSPPDDPRICVALFNRGLTLEHLGRFEEALSVLEEATARFRRSEGPAGGRTVAAGLRLARLHGKTGAQGKALEILSTIGNDLGHSRDQSHPMLTSVLRQLGETRLDVGDHAAAHEVLERALALETEKPRPSLFQTAAIEKSLGMACAQLERRVQALVHYGKAIDLFRSEPEDNAVNIVRTLEGRALVMVEMGREDEGLAELRTVLERKEQLLGPKSPSVAVTLHNIAEQSLRRGRYEEAVEIFRRLIAIRETTLPLHHPHTTESRSRLSLALARLGRFDEAVDEAWQAFEDSLLHASETIARMPERQALRFQATRPGQLDVLLSLALAAPDPSRVRVAWDAVVRSRAQVLDQVSWRHQQSLASPDPEIRAIAKNLAATRSELARLFYATGIGSRPELQERLRRTRQQRATLERELARRSPHFRRDLENRSAGLDRVRSALPSGSGLVAYVRCHREHGLTPGRPSGRPSERASSEAWYVALVMPPNDAPAEILPLGSVSTIDALVTSWRREAALGPLTPGRTPQTAERVYRTVARDLADVVWKPMAETLVNCERIFVVPEGSLHLVPFPALPAADSYLVEHGPVFQNLVCERDLLLAGLPPSGGAGLLAIGGADYGDVETGAPRRWRQGLSFRPIPESKREAVDLASEFLRHQSEDPEPVYLHTGAEATEPLFKELAPRCELVHLAIHGFYLGSPLRPGEGSRGASRIVSAGPTSTRPDPLLLSGLAFAGVNDRARLDDADQDGIVTAEEIATLDLRNVEWVVLSGCETGVGTIEPGDGVLGLSRAFRVAGARSVIMSLWPVQDLGTREFMSALYAARFEKGLGAGDAVRAASHRILERRRLEGLSTHPFYWAAFSSTGDWR